MPVTPHIERHFSASETVRDVVIGMADGLTVPFALAAGLSGAIASTDIIVVAGLAEIAAGAIAMGLGGYLAARTDAQHYESERRREVHEVQHLADRERHEVAEIFHGYGLSGPQLDSVVAAISAECASRRGAATGVGITCEYVAPGTSRGPAASEGSAGSSRRKLLSKCSVCMRRW